MQKPISATLEFLHILLCSLLYYLYHIVIDYFMDDVTRYPDRFFLRDHKTIWIHITSSLEKIQQNRSKNMDKFHGGAYPLLRLF